MSLNEDNYISPLQHQEKMIIKREALDDDKFTESDEDGCLQEVFLGSQKVKLEVEQSDNSCERSSELNHFENSTDASFRIKHEPENSLTSALKEEIHIEEYKPAPAGWELAGAGRSGSLEIFKDEFARSESVRESEVQSSGSKSKADVRYNCAHCPYKTNRRGNYIKHYIRKHKQCREVYKCQECSFETKRECDLTKHHKRKHSEDSKLYKCQECSYITKYKSSLIRHYNRKHVKEAAGWGLAGAGRSGSLEIFKDEFARSESVRESEVQSSGSKSKADVRYNCAHCPYKTNRKGNYIKHYIRKHKQCREVYKCQECSFETKHEYDLTKHHKRKHSEDSKLYKCQECSYITKYKSSLIRHYNRKHVVKEAAEMFKCPECSYEARKKNHLTQHYNNKHK